MTKAQDTHDRIEALVAEGTTKADAFKTLAKELGQSVDSVRGAYYSARRATGTAPTRARRRNETSADDAIAAAIASLEKSIQTIQAEVTDAENRATEAEREHHALRDAAGPKIEAIQTKIDALKATDAEK